MGLHARIPPCRRYGNMFAFKEMSDLLSLDVIKCFVTVFGILRFKKQGGDMRKTTFMFIGFMLVAGGGARADFRVWSSMDGTSNVEAQFVQMAGPKVVLETTDGRRIMVPKARLCAKDKEFLATVIPPEIKFEVDVDVDKEKKGDGWYYEQKTELIESDVVISKTNKDASTQKLKAYVYIFAKEKGGDNFSILDKQTRDFSFEDASAFRITSTCSASSSENWSSSGGYEYEGYVIFVTDLKGHVFSAKSNKSQFEEQYPALSKCGKGDRFTKKFVKLPR